MKIIMKIILLIKTFLLNLITFKKPLLPESVFEITLPEHSPRSKNDRELYDGITQISTILIQQANSHIEQIKHEDVCSVEYDQKMTRLVEFISIKKRLEKMLPGDPA